MAATFALQSFRSLLLNSTYEPMKVVSWQKALVLWFQDKVEILEYHPAFARSSREHFRLPSVLRLKTYIRPKNHGVVRFCRENVYLRDHHTCQYCHEKYAAKSLTLDHVIPVSKRGPKSWTNVVTACRVCNQKKGNRTPLGAGMPLLKEPVAPRWLPNPELENRAPGNPENWSAYLQTTARKTG